jgi:hypothetical protein
LKGRFGIWVLFGSWRFGTWTLLLIGGPDGARTHDLMTASSPSHYFQSE